MTETATFFPAFRPPADRYGLTLWCAFRGHQLLVIEDGDTYCLPEWDEFARSGLVPLQQIYLGTLGQQHCYVLELAEATDAPPGMTFLNLRPLLTHLSTTHFAVAGRAYQIMTWHRDHQFCSRCGTSTEQEPTERVKRCPNCDFSAYPRISPAVIMLIYHEDKILLSRSPHHPKGMMTIQAGFVEAGENLEETLRREIREEVGLEVKNIRYFGSQSWPFPNSLMIAFTAEYASGELVVNRDELETGNWFSVKDIPAHLPPKMSIAYQLIEWFLHEQG